MKISLNKRVISFLFLTIVFVLMFGLISSKISNAKTNTDDTQYYYSTTTNSSCADFYGMNSVKIDIKPKIINSSNGSPIGFFGKIINTNKYPIINGRLFVKVLRENQKGNTLSADVVDAFVVKENIILSAGQEIPIDFNWKIPAFAVSGDYKLVSYFIANDKFNLAGFSFTDNIVGDTASFKVSGVEKTGVSFKKDAVKIKNSKYISGSVFNTGANNPVSISIPVVNTTKKPQAVRAEFNVYKLDAQAVENKIDTIEKMVIVEAGKIVEVPIVINDNQSAVYYVESILKYKDTKSILGLRLSRESINTPKINFVTISKFPIISGEENKISSCFQNISSSGKSTDGKLKLEIISGDNQVVLSYEYDGKIPNSQSSISQSFVPQNTLREFKIHATLSNGDKIVDEVFIPYSCNQINSEKCNGFFDNLTSNKIIKTVFSFLGILVLLFIIILLFVKFNLIKTSLLNLMGKNTKVIIKSIIIFVLFGAVFVSSANFVFAEQVLVASSSDSGSGGGPDVGGGCFKIDSYTPASTPSCVKPNNCTPSTVDVLLNGSGLSQIKSAYINHLGQMSIISNNDTSITVRIPRPTGETSGGPLNLNLLDKPLLPKCSARVPIRFRCDKPEIETVELAGVFPRQTNEGQVGDTVTLTVKNAGNVKKIKLDGKSITDFSVTNIPGSTTGKIEFRLPSMTAGCKDLSLISACWDKNIKPIKNAICVEKRSRAIGNGGGGLWPSWSYPYGLSQSTHQTETEYGGLYHWFSNDNNDLENGNWDNAIYDSIANINYEFNIVDDYGVSIFDGQSIPVGRNVHFNFDTTNSTRNNISWIEYANPYTSPSVLGHWVDSASYPAGNVCTSDNYLKNKLYTNSATGQNFGDVNVFVPLSVSPPTRALSFVSGSPDTANLIEDDYPEAGAPLVLGNDSNSWYCENDINDCKPISSGWKKTYMYMAPTYGYFYYGWQTSEDTANGYCRTNDVVLHSKTTMSLNNQNYQNTPPNDVGQLSCAIGSTDCGDQILYSNTIGQTRGCPIIEGQYYPYYNADTDKCYPDQQSYIDSYHPDADVYGSNIITDYFSPYKLNFRESIYQLNINVTDDVSNITPSAPIIEGPDSVNINVENTYTAFSVVGSARKDSMLASVISIIKKVFAQTSEPTTKYLFDWDASTPEIDYESPAVGYGEKVSGLKTWSEVGVITIRVAAQDAISGNMSPWTEKEITITSQVESIAAPTLMAEKCSVGQGSPELKISWDTVEGAEQYSLYIIHAGGLPEGQVTIQAGVNNYIISNYNTSDTYRAYAIKSDPDNVGGYITSESSNTIRSSDISSGTFCQNGGGEVGIKSGIKFFPMGWAKETTNKCDFSGSVDTTVVDSSDKVYSSVVVASCSVGGALVSGNIISGQPFIFTGQYGVGKRVLSCDASYKEGTTTKSVNFTMESKCSRSPNVIEK